MPQNKKHIINHRRGEVSRFYLQGLTQPEIAEKLGVSQSQVSRDLKHVIAGQWQLTAMEDLAARKAQDLAELSLIKAELWQAWQLSKQKKADGPDPRFVAELLKAFKQIAQLLGYDAALKLDITFDQFSDAQVDQILTKLLTMKTVKPKQVRRKTRI